MIFPISGIAFIILLVTQAKILGVTFILFFPYFPISHLLPKPVSFTNKIHFWPAHFFQSLLHHHNLRPNLFWHGTRTFADILAPLLLLFLSNPFFYSVRKFYPIDATASGSRSWEHFKDVTQCLRLNKNNHWLIFFFFDTQNKIKIICIYFKI